MLGCNLEKWKEKNWPPGGGVTFHCATYLISLHLKKKSISLQIFGGLTWKGQIRYVWVGWQWRFFTGWCSHGLMNTFYGLQQLKMKMYTEELRLLSFRLHWSDYCFLASDAKATDTSKEAFEETEKTLEDESAHSSHQRWSLKLKH